MGIIDFCLQGYLAGTKGQGQFLGVCWCEKDLISEAHGMRGHFKIHMLKGGDYEAPSKRISGCNITDKGTMT